MPFPTPSKILCNQPRALATMEKLGLDALVVSDARNVYYLSNFTSSLLWNWSGVAFAIYPRDPRIPATLIVTGLDLPFLIDDPTWMPHVRTYALKEIRPGETERIDFKPLVHAGRPLGDHERKALELFAEVHGMLAPDSETAVASTLKDLGLASARLAFDDMRLAHILKDGQLPSVQISDGRDIMRDIRMVKTAPEIEIMKEAAWRNEEALKAAVAATRPGVSWGSIVQAYSIRLIELGGQPRYLMRGAGEFGQVRVNLLEYEVRAGDLVMYDAFGQFKHYSADLGRTAYLGKAPDEVKARYEALRAGWKAGCDRIRPGMSTADLSASIHDSVHAAGFPEYGFPTPHSVGLEHFDHPQQKSFYQPFVLEENNILNVDMPFFEYGWGAIHLEDTILVHKDGVEYLTSNETALIELEG